MPNGMREAAGQSFKISENPVTALVPEFRDSALKKRIVFHEFQSDPGDLFSSLEEFYGDCRALWLGMPTGIGALRFAQLFT